MRILDQAQIKSWDDFSIQSQGIESHELMERAAIAFTKRFIELFPMIPNQKGWVLAGPGNNGGDALAIARLLVLRGYSVSVLTCNFGRQQSPDNVKNEALLPKEKLDSFHKGDSYDLTEIAKPDWIVDGLLGTGFRGQIGSELSDLISMVNSLSVPVISIDLPSGMHTDEICVGQCICATKVLTFQSPKLAFVLPENSKNVGDWEILDIDLDLNWLNDQKIKYEFSVDSELLSLIKPRDKFAHKGSFGHALIIGGSSNYSGSVALASKAALRSGCGLVSVLAPNGIKQIVQGYCIESTWISNKNEEHLSLLPQLQDSYNLGIGPGMGTNPETAVFLNELLQKAKQPIVIDADALNLISLNRGFFKHIPAQSILTPHPKEFDRLFGDHHDTKERLIAMPGLCKKYQINLILKGHHTAICGPDGLIYFNGTGNSGMATGGSGDVLTGIIVSLLCQGYELLLAARVGVWLHGKAGDVAARKRSEHSLIASDIIECLGEVFLSIEQNAQL
ncbi:MAG: NAD(P)H-hydrate dehydratase [Saprospiraceae bacterium]